MRKGYIKISRAICDSDLFETPAVAGLYLWMVAHANWGDTFNGLKAGELNVSRNSLCKIMNLSRNSISTYFRWLEEHGYIRMEKNGKLTKISVLKFAEYGQGSTNEKQQSGLYKNPFGPA